MNQQAISLQKMAASIQPEKVGGIKWLIHSAGTGAGVSTIRDNLELVLQQMGWNTGQFRGKSGTALAQVCATEENAIDIDRLVPNALLIFVLDGTPDTLVNTYSQIKQLLAERPTLQDAISVISNRPRLVSELSNPKTPTQNPEALGEMCEGETGFAQCPAKILIRSCQRFLEWEPTYLGALPYDSLIGVAASEEQLIVQRWPSATWSILLQRSARRALMINKQIEESTQEPDMLSRSLSVAHSAAEEAYPTLA